VPAGTYTLYVLVEDPEHWKLIINNQTGQNGDSYDPSMDLGRVEMEMEKPSVPIENLKYTITTKGDTGKLQLEWGEPHCLGFVPGDIACCPGYLGGIVVRVLSKHPRFGPRSNYTKSNRLRAAPVPNVYLGCDGEPVFAGPNLQAGRRRPVKPRPMSAESLSRNHACFGHPSPRAGTCLPDAHQRNEGPFPPQRNGILRGIQPKHFIP
jgi:hypothetical protein